MNAYERLRSRTRVVRGLMPKFEADGFRVLLNPELSTLPERLRAEPPVAIGIGDASKLAIDVVERPDLDLERTGRLRAAVATIPGWKAMIIHAHLPQDQIELPSLGKHDIDARLDALPELLSASGSVPTILTAWSILEAAARHADPKRFRRIWSPGDLIGDLASNGPITPDEADTLRAFERLRNRAAHGDLTVEVDAATLIVFTDIVRTLMREYEPVPT